MAAKGTGDQSKLPPTENPAYLHCLRAIYQTTVWESLDVFCLDPCDYGWSVIEGAYTPTQSTVPCGPEDLLKLVRCKCRAGCLSGNCSCKKHGLKCAAACQNCRGDCENSQVC